MEKQRVELSQKILSDIVIFTKYAKYVPEAKRRETWDDLCDRNMVMHIRKYPQLKDEIKEVYAKFVRTKKVLPSMRSMQFAGLPIELNQSRIFNCAYMPMDHPFAFAELMFLLLGGTGVGYSVQKRHVDKLPSIVGPTTKTRRYLVADNIAGWADAIKMLIKAYTNGKADPVFDYRDIRHKGTALITTGGKAPGPDPLRVCVDQIRSVLNNAIGRKLKTIEVHDICCHIADAVLSGGIRRAAMIAGFDIDDLDMLSCKSGNWYELHPARGRANNSVILKRGEVTQEQFQHVLKLVELSGAGEPGFFWTNDYDVFTNPCGEISLAANQFCNLNEVNVSNVTSQEDLNERVKAAAFLGTLQAGYTDFHYLRSVWKETTERDALIGVGMTGICSSVVLGLDLEAAAKVVNAENVRVAAIININAASRTTTVKPSGNSSAVLGTSSGIHAWHNDFYIRRMRVGKGEPLYAYLKETLPDLIEDCVFKPHLDAVLSLPQRAPEGAILRSESVLDMLNRVKKFNLEWVHPGRISGINNHNVSCTVSIKNDEWSTVGDWLWQNRENYTGISVLPYDGGTYVQAPFEDCSEERYSSMLELLRDIDITKVIEDEDGTNLAEELACSGGACEVK